MKYNISQLWFGTATLACIQLYILCPKVPVYGNSLPNGAIALSISKCLTASSQLALFVTENVTNLLKAEYNTALVFFYFQVSIDP